ncbi:MAG: TlpA family protein disulfide reductase [Chitinophagaceae bacterium]|nr:TlpA family protein disulfide reductase [Chitinophagaceae bacterium]
MHNIKWLLLILSFYSCLEPQKDLYKKDLAPAGMNSLVAKDSVKTEKCATIIVSLSKMSSIALNYIDVKNKESPSILFRNSTHRDTLICKTVFIDRPTHFQHIVLGNYQQFSNFILLPNDTIYLAVTNSYVLNIAKYSRFNGFIDSIFGIKDYFDFNRTTSYAKVGSKKVRDLIQGIESSYNNSRKLIKNLFYSKKVDSVYGNYLSDFNLILKYYKISNIFFDQSDPPANINELLGKYYEHTLDNFSLLSNINTGCNYSIIYNSIRYNAYKKGKLSNNFWDYFNLVDDSIKSTNLYKSYLFTYLLNDETIKNTASLKKKISQISSSGIDTQNFDSLIVHREQAESLKSLIGVGIENISGDSGSYYTLIKNLESHYVLVDFWASWCAPCRAQMPALRKMKEALSNQNVAFISISIDNDNQREEWIAASKDENLYTEIHNYRLLKGNKNKLLKMMKIEAVPRYILYGPDGKIIDNNFITPGDKDFKKTLLKYVSPNID